MLKKITLTLLCAFSLAQATEPNTVKLRSLFDISLWSKLKIAYIALTKTNSWDETAKNAKALAWLQWNRSFNSHSDLVCKHGIVHQPRGAFLETASPEHFPTMQKQLEDIFNTYEEGMILNKQAIDNLNDLLETNPLTQVSYTDDISVVLSTKKQLDLAGYSSTKLLKNLVFDRRDDEQVLNHFKEVYDTIKNDPSVPEKYKEFLREKLYPREYTPEEYKDSWKFIHPIDAQPVQSK